LGPAGGKAHGHQLSFAWRARPQVRIARPDLLEQAHNPQLRSHIDRADPVANIGAWWVTLRTPADQFDEGAVSIRAQEGGDYR